MRDLSTIVKAYDVRGVVPDELDEDVARRVGAGFARFTDAPEIVVGYDMRNSSVPLSAAFADGATSQGADVVMIGLASTDLLYFASGRLDRPGAMFTASHNPARYNGIKMCRAGAAPVGQETGLREVRRLAEEGVAPVVGPAGDIRERDMLDEYAQYLHQLVDISGVRPLKAVVDAGNGMAGLTVPRVFDGLPIDLTPMYFELDGSFPNHEANPIDPANLRDLQGKVCEVGADIGLAFDGDADRCFVVDEQGEIVSPSVLTALIAVRELGKRPGSRVIHNLITSRAVPEIIREYGGIPVRTRVGHSFIKGEMARTGAIFGGEHSGHFYFQRFWRADSGMIAALHTLAALGGQGEPLSRLLARYSRYVASGEINSTVVDQRAKLEEIEVLYAVRSGCSADHLDGLTIDSGTWWFNVRPSNTEPLLRLNVEAPDGPTMQHVRDEVLSLIRGERSS
ncbi:MAG: phosphomannomutase/phosphoglucomutase [Frankiaceae bacterium]